MSLIGCNIGYFGIRFGIFAHLPVLISTPKSCQDLLFIVYICIGFPWSSRSQILKELDGLDLSSNPVQSSPIQSLPCCNRIRNRHSSLFKEHCHFYSFATISRLADNYGELLTLSNPTPGGPSVFERYRRPSSNRSSHAFVDEGRERSHQLYLKW